MELDAKYLAGFFDGEGSVSGTIDGNGYRKLQVTLANNYKPILEHVQAHFNGSLNISTHKCWQWCTGAADDMFTFLTYVQPHVIIKVREVAIALAITSVTKPKGGRYTPHEILVRERLFEMLKEAGDERKKAYE